MSVHLMWWQGADQMPSHYKGIVEKWQTLGHSDVHIWSGDEIIQALSFYLSTSSEELDASDTTTLTRILSFLKGDKLSVIQKCDVGRLVILYLVGGIYADLDYSPLKPHFELLNEIIAQRCDFGIGRINNAWMACVNPRSVLFTKGVFPIVVQNCSRSSTGILYLDIFLLAGPMFWEHNNLNPMIGKYVHTFSFSTIYLNFGYHWYAGTWTSEENTNSERTFPFHSSLFELLDFGTEIHQDLAVPYSKFRYEHILEFSLTLFVIGAVVAFLTKSMTVVSALMFLMLYIDSSFVSIATRGRQPNTMLTSLPWLLGAGVSFLL